MGKRTASVVMVWEMVPRFTVAACTETTGCGSAFSFEQPAMHRVAAASSPRVILLRIAMQLKDAGKRLQISDCQPVPGFPIIIVVTRCHQRILCINDFQSGR